MDDNDMLPNDGSYYQLTEPESQVDDRRKQQSKAQAAKPMLKELIALFDADIAHLNSIESIPVDIDTEPDKFLQAWRINQELRHYAENKKQYLESLLLTVR